MMYEIHAIRKTDRKTCLLRGWYKSDRDMFKKLVKQYRIVQWVKY